MPGVNAMKAKSTWMVAALALGLASSASASEWKQEFAPYLWASSMEGTVGLGDVEADASLSFSDLLDNLELGFMGTYRASRDRYSVLVDAIYMGLGMVQKGPAGVLKSDVDVDQIGLEIDFGYDVGQGFTVLGGARYVDLDTHIRVSGPLDTTESVHQEYDWIDPVIGLQWHQPISGDWSVTLHGDAGGFGVGSQFAWQAFAILRWQFSPTIGAALGYRYLDIDYEDGRGANRFKYDVATSGPALGIVFTF
jgi:opacity protein-like surface antigen